MLPKRRGWFIPSNGGSIPKLSRCSPDADKTGKVRCKNFLGYANVEVKKPMMLVDEGKVSLL